MTVGAGPLDDRWMDHLGVRPSRRSQRAMYRLFMGRRRRLGELVMEEANSGWSVVRRSEMSEFDAERSAAERLSECKSVADVRELWDVLEPFDALLELALAVCPVDPFSEEPSASTLKFEFNVDDHEDYDRLMWLEMATYDLLEELPEEPPFSEWEYVPDFTAWVPAPLVQATLVALHALGYEVEMRGNVPDTTK